MQVPSGRDFDSYDVRFVQLAVRYNLIRGSRDPIFGTRSGQKTRVYIGGREDLTDHPDLEWFIGRLIASRVFQDARSRGDKNPQCLIGIPTAGTALAQAAAMATHNRYDSGLTYVIHRVMREIPKDHGMHAGWVNGDPDPGHTYWLVDNTVTDAASKVVALEQLYRSRYPIDNIPGLLLVDRQEGGIGRMIKAGFSRVVAVYGILDILSVIDSLGLWPREVVQAIREEVQSHQVVA